MTFSSPSWRSLNPLEGSLNHPKKVTLNHQATTFFSLQKKIFEIKALPSSVPRPASRSPIPNPQKKSHAFAPVECRRHKNLFEKKSGLSEKGKKREGEVRSPLHFKTVTSLLLTGDGASAAAVLLLVFTEGFDKRNTFLKNCESCTQVYRCLYSHHLMVASITITHRSGG